MNNFSLFHGVLTRLILQTCKNQGLVGKGLKSLQNDKLLDWTKLKAFADDKFQATKMKISVFDRVQNIVGKGENAGYTVKRVLLQGHQKSGFCVKKFNYYCLHRNMFTTKFSRFVFTRDKIK